MANQLDIGRCVEGLVEQASAYFPQLAPIRFGRDVGRDVWRVQTRVGQFEFSEAVVNSRRQLVEFLTYQLHRMAADAERDERYRQTHLRVGDRITVNGFETRIVAINPNEITVEQLDPRDGLGRCDCPQCRERAVRRQMADVDAMRYGTFRYPNPSEITPAAEARSLELLRQHLTPEQRRQWEQERSIEVRGGRTGNRYRIRGEIAAYNIDRIGDGAVRLCCTPGQPGEVPLGDYILGQKLALELDEERFLGEANFAGGMDPRVAMRADARVPRGVVTTTEDLDRLIREAWSDGRDTVELRI